MTLTTARSVRRARGQMTNINGAAGSTTWGARRPRRRRPPPSFRQCSPRCLHAQLIPTIVQMASRIGKQDGPQGRRSGAAGCTEKVVLEVEVVANQEQRRRFRTIAAPDTRTGRRDGRSPRRRGAVRTQARAARRTAEAAEVRSARALQDLVKRERPA